MGLFTRNKNKIQQIRSVNLGDVFGLDCPRGYRQLSKCPEIIAGVDRIASLIGSMTIHLYQNTDQGDEIIKDRLARVLDVEPNSYMTRHNFINWIVKTLYLDGKGNAVVVPITEDGYLRSLNPVAPSKVNIDDSIYMLTIDGTQKFPSDVLHFVLNPSCEKPWKGDGFAVQLRDVCETLTQAQETRKDFLSNKIMPSVIVNIQTDIEEMSDPATRDKIADQYLSQTKKGSPWIIPADLMSVQQIKPLTLADIAINESITLDKKQVASLLGIPTFVLGEGAYNKDEWNNFISTQVMSIAQIIQQEMTRKLLYSPERYIAFSPRSLLAYSMTELSDVGCKLMERGMMTGNEVRDWIGLSPKADLDKLTMLENYIPADKIGDQKKLKGNDSNA